MTINTEAHTFPTILSYSGKQPDNVMAWRIGESCDAASKDPKCGDPIDRGLILMRELEARGLGIVPLPPNAGGKPRCFATSA